MIRNHNSSASLLFILGLLLLFLSAPVLARNAVFMEQADFLSAVFPEQVPQSASLWLNRDVREPLEKILREPLRGARLHYWQADGRTAWVLESIGKERPITVGVAVENNAIVRLNVLTYREDRGWEVRYPFFTDQFLGVGFDERQKLNQSIDGITGATLSVRALKRIARAALYLHERVAE